MGDPKLATHVKKWFGVCDRLWPILWASEGLAPAQLRARADIQLLYAELRERTKPLAVAAEQLGISSQPLHELTGFLEVATDKIWDDARLVVKRLEAIAAGGAPPDDATVKAANKQALLGLFARRGLAPIAYLSEAAWNLREWLREVAAHSTLQPVLSSLLPAIRRRIELSLLDGELSRFVGDLPDGATLTAASLIAFIEGLELPDKIRIRVPAGKPPLEWMTLSRKRAQRIALQLCNEDGTPMYDSESDSDLDTIEKMDHKVLARLWNSIESFDPLNEPGGTTNRPKETRQGQAEPQPDGPFPPTNFRHNGVSYTISRPAVWRLINALWNAANRTLAFDELAEPVWEDREYDVGTNNVGSLRRDGNRFFKSNGIPLEIVVKNRFCSIRST
jgi:hypothetical protein